MSPHLPALVTVGTALGVCALAFSAAGVTRLWLPESTDAALAARLSLAPPPAGTLPIALADAPPWVVRASRSLVRHLAGGRVDLTSIPIDLGKVPPFHAKVYAQTRRIPVGATCSYGELAALVGSPGAARAVGQAMARNPVPLLVPCHRVLASGKRPGGFTATGGLTAKAQILAAEGYRLDVAPARPLRLPRD